MFFISVKELLNLCKDVWDLKNRWETPSQTVQLAQAIVRLSIWTDDLSNREAETREKYLGGALVFLDGTVVVP